MKKKFLSVICTVVAMLMMCTVLAGCFAGKEETPVDTTPKEYTIQYTDESGAHTITVTDGMPFSLDVVPEKTGYDFMGLYDAEVGGTQYISASGSSLAPFTDKKNMVLFPQYKAKEYTVVLDYQGAAVMGSRQLTVEYGSSLPELPKNLTGEHKEFLGWYTAAECGGTQIADEYGLIPLVSVLNEQNFDLSSSSVTLYAGFETEKHTVTFCFEAGMDTEEVQVAYNTPISQVVPQTRVDGNAVLNWSKTQGGNPWNGKVTSDMVLYAVEYAPVIDFDCNDGSEVTPVVARAGDTIVLPTPTKDLAKFSHWEDMSGNRFEATTMPAKSTTLKAIWQGKLVFDENGGSDVDDISVAAGTKITLPTPEKEGFIFAGWYTADKEQYTSSKMPATGVALKAGWYKEIKKEIIENNKRTIEAGKEGLCWHLSFDMDNDKMPSEGIEVKIDFTFQAWHGKTRDDTYNNIFLQFYSENTTNANLAISEQFVYKHGSIDGYQNRSMQTRLRLYKTDFYLRFTSTATYNNAYVKNCKIALSYPDTTNLYL